MDAAVTLTTEERIGRMLDLETGDVKGLYETCGVDKAEHRRVERNWNMRRKVLQLSIPPLARETLLPQALVRRYIGVLEVVVIFIMCRKTVRQVW